MQLTSQSDLVNPVSPANNMASEQISSMPPPLIWSVPKFANQSESIQHYEEIPFITAAEELKPLEEDRNQTSSPPNHEVIETSTDRKLQMILEQMEHLNKKIDKMDKRISLLQVTLEQVKDVVYTPSVNRSATLDKNFEFSPISNEEQFVAVNQQLGEQSYYNDLKTWCELQINSSDTDNRLHEARDLLFDRHAVHGDTTHSHALGDTRCVVDVQNSVVQIHTCIHLATHALLCGEVCVLCPVVQIYTHTYLATHAVRRGWLGRSAYTHSRSRLYFQSSEVGACVVFQLLVVSG